MDYRCLLFDLDDTLLRSDKTISPRTLRALESCREQGLLIGIATNRAENRIEPFLDALKPDVVISNGGALVRFNGEIVFRAEFSQAETRAVLDLIRQVCGADVEITVDGENVHLWNFKADPGNRDNGLSGRTYCDFSHYSGTAMRITAAVTDETYAALKMCVEITDDTYPALKAALPECDCQRFSGENWCKITRRDATKENALQELCRASGLTLAEIVAFGDDAPDIGMLRLCGLGVAMGNAIPAVKVAADVVIGTNDEDGIAEWLEEWMKRMPYKELGGSHDGHKQTLDHTGDPA